MKRNDAIEKFNQPCYEGVGDDNNQRLYWFNFMICWRQISSRETEHGNFRHLKVCDGLLYEVCDNGRVLQKVTPDTQAKYQMSQVDNILLGEEDEQS